MTQAPGAAPAMSRLATILGFGALALWSTSNALTRSLVEALGPFTLLGESNFNYWGKMMFKWVYWNKLITGEELPLEAQLNLAGKLQD